MPPRIAAPAPHLAAPMRAPFPASQEASCASSVFKGSWVFIVGWVLSRRRQRSVTLAGPVALGIVAMGLGINTIENKFTLIRERASYDARLKSNCGEYE